MLLACLVELVDRLFRQALDRLKRLAGRVGNRLDREEAIVAKNLDNLIKRVEERGWTLEWACEKEDDGRIRIEC